MKGLEMTDTTVTLEPKNPILNDKWYRILEFVARVLLPGLGTLYLAVAALWGVENGPQVVGTIVAVDTFLGLFLGVAQRSYDNSDAAYNGSIVVEDSENGVALHSLVLDQDPTEVDKLVLKINPNTS